VAAITRATGQSLGKAQVEALAAVAATDIDVFYELRRPGPCPDGDTLVMTFDGNGVVMCPEALRPATAKAAARTGNKLATRLSRGEKEVSASLSNGRSIGSFAEQWQLRRAGTAATRRS